MPQDMLKENSQVKTTLAAIQSTLKSNLQAIYLHGSAVSGGLRPQSDLDLLAVIDGSMNDNQRRALIAALLPISAPHPTTPGGPRCIELVVCDQSDLLGDAFPARVEFIYGEWLRDAFMAGDLSAAGSDPEYTLLLAQACQRASLLWGRDVLTAVPAASIKHIRQAMRDGLEPLQEGLQGDERNVLLTLARMWRTAVAGDFVTKEQAAAWAIPQLAQPLAGTLDDARRAYLGELADSWAGRSADVLQLAQELVARIKQAL